MKRMDTIGWYVATMHQLIGHEKTARYIGFSVEEGEQRDCILCQYERGEVTQDDVLERLGTEMP